MTWATREAGKTITFMGNKQAAIVRSDIEVTRPGLVLQTLKWSTFAILVFSLAFSLLAYESPVGVYNGKDSGLFVITAPFILISLIIWYAVTPFSLGVGLSAAWIIVAIAFLTDSKALNFHWEWFAVYFTFMNIALFQISLAMISWLFGDFKQRKKSYPFYAFAGSLAIMWFYWEREIHTVFIKDRVASDVEVYQCLLVIGLVLLLLAPVLRHGNKWERFIAALLCVFPILGLADLFQFVFTELF